MKCQIQWIDCSGRPTSDDEPAIGMAVFTASNGVEHRFPVCANHYKSIGKVHHDPQCRHRNTGPTTGVWTFEKFPTL